MDEPVAKSWKRTSFELPNSMIAQIDVLRREWGLRHRGAVVERLLQQLFGAEAGDAPLPETLERAHRVAEETEQEELDEQVALVLVRAGALEELQVQRPDSSEPEPVEGARRGGIDLPGFVQRRAREIKRGLRPPQPERQPTTVPPLSLSKEDLDHALAEARDHWQRLYGHSPSPTVLENAMIWLAHDIWPHCDQNEGRLFTWSAACHVMREFAPSWGDDPATFERVMVVAGVLEDPFSASTLALRLPTLIRRFVQRFRRRSRGTSFQTLEHTMTLQGALKLLQLPTNMGQRLTLREIRDAYREMALSHHPDAGGSAEAMRRINEAYQLLKELYRPRSAKDDAPSVVS